MVGSEYVLYVQVTTCLPAHLGIIVITEILILCYLKWVSNLMTTFQLYHGEIKFHFNEMMKLAPHMKFTDPVHILLGQYHTVKNISYWLPLNEGFRYNCIKTNKYVKFVLKKRGDNSTTNHVFKIPEAYWLQTSKNITGIK
jgi:hypothetical protein